jgi:trimeric autotransporter adhesin
MNGMLGKILGILTNPQPWLTDIEFDIDNAMVLGLRDRWGDQMGFRNYAPTPNGNFYIGVAAGDILRAGKCSGATTWTIENDATVCGLQTIGRDTIEGPGSGEYYWSDLHQSNASVSHEEIVYGGLALVPGSGEVIATVMDPYRSITGGIRHFVNNTGNKGASFELYNSDIAYMGKANGMGDIEALSDLPPLEIGNRVWEDANPNGVQDANEAGIGSITIDLYQGATQVGTTTTNATDGSWYFNNTNVNLNGATGLLPNTAYTIRIASANIPSGKILTTANAGGAGQPDVRDNDASLVSGNVEIAYTTGTAGQNDHTLDIGFKPAPLCAVTATLAKSSDLTCAAPTATLTVTTTPATGVTYVWSAGATPVAGTNTATVSAAGNYTVTITETATSCFITSNSVNVANNVVVPACIPITVTKTK